jgi:hypothetical protein
MYYLAKYHKDKHTLNEMADESKLCGINLRNNILPK